MKTLFKLSVVSLIVGLLFSIFVQKIIATPLQASPKQYISACSNELSENLPQLEYKVIKKGFPFYSYEVEPNVEKDSTCIGMAAILLNTETYGSRGPALNWIFYTLMSVIISNAALFIKKKYAHHRH